MSALASCLYRGTVMHRRYKPRTHRLAYRVFTLLVDLDELSRLDREMRTFSLNRFNLFSFHERDHGDGDGSGLRAWVEGHLARGGIDLGGGAIRLMCYPRVLGYVFNPLSVYFCYRADGCLAAILYEVNNTFGERHGYLIPVAEPEAKAVRQRCEKEFYVSPFIAMEGTYDFRITPPGERAAMVIDESDREGPVLRASFVGRKGPLTDRTLMATILRYPMLTLKIIAGIHWEALRLWLKGVPLVRRPAPPAHAVTVVAAPKP